MTILVLRTQEDAIADYGNLFEEMLKDLYPDNEIRYLTTDEEFSMNSSVYFKGQTGKFSFMTGGMGRSSFHRFAYEMDSFLSEVMEWPLTCPVLIDIPMLIASTFIILSDYRYICINVKEDGAVKGMDGFTLKRIDNITVHRVV